MEVAYAQAQGLGDSNRLANRWKSCSAKTSSHLYYQRIVVSHGVSRVISAIYDSWFSTVRRPVYSKTVSTPSDAMTKRLTRRLQACQAHSRTCHHLLACSIRVLCLAMMITYPLTMRQSSKVNAKSRLASSRGRSFSCWHRIFERRGWSALVHCSDS